jgi:hypothetical protein
MRGYFDRQIKPLQPCDESNDIVNEGESDSEPDFSADLANMSWEPKATPAPTPQPIQHVSKPISKAPQKVDDDEDRAVSFDSTPIIEAPPIHSEEPDKIDTKQIDQVSPKPQQIETSDESTHDDTVLSESEEKRKLKNKLIRERNERKKRKARQAKESRKQKTKGKQYNGLRKIDFYTSDYFVHESWMSDLRGNVTHSSKSGGGLPETAPQPIDTDRVISNLSENLSGTIVRNDLRKN